MIKEVNYTHLYENVQGLKSMYLIEPRLEHDGKVTTISPDYSSYSSPTREIDNANWLWLWLWLWLAHGNVCLYVFKVRYVKKVKCMNLLCINTNTAINS